MPTLIEWDIGVPELQVLLDEVALARQCQARPDLITAGRTLPPPTMRA